MLARAVIPYCRICLQLSMRPEFQHTRPNQIFGGGKTYRDEGRLQVRVRIVYVEEVQNGSVVIGFIYIDSQQ